MSARETLHSDLLTTPAAATLPHPEGWASIRRQTRAAMQAGTATQ